MNWESTTNICPFQDRKHKTTIENKNNNSLKFFNKHKNTLFFDQIQIEFLFPVSLSSDEVLEE